MSGNNPQRSPTAFSEANQQRQTTIATQTAHPNDNDQLFGFRGQEQMTQTLLDNDILPKLPTTTALNAWNLTLLHTSSLAKRLKNVSRDAIFHHGENDYPVICPISSDVMIDPVKVTITNSGQTYVHAFDLIPLLMWIEMKGNTINPLNNLFFSMDKVEYFQELKDHINKLATYTYCGFKPNFINARGKLGLF